MPKYLLEVKYTLEGVKGLLAQGGTAREAAAQAAAETLGGNVDSFFYAFGEQDLFGIIDMPDNASMAAYALTVTAGGGVTTRTVPLLSPAELDEAAGKQVGYRPPGS